MATVSSVKDLFGDSDTDVQWSANYTDAAVTVAETGGVLQLTVTTGGGVGYSGYRTAASYDLTSDSATVELVSGGTQGARYQTYFQMWKDDSNGVYFLLEASILEAWKLVAGSTTLISSAAYNSTNHRWLRIRESGGTTYWDTSPDAYTWTNFTSQANPFVVTAVGVEIGAGSYTSPPAAQGVAQWDNLNVSPLSVSVTIGSAGV